MPRTTLIIAAAVAVAALLGGWYFLGSPHYTNYPPRPGPLIAFGDSLVAGSGSTEGKGFVSRVSETVGEPIENFGVPGDTTAQALARIDEPLSRHPRIAIILLGGNDYLKRVPKEQTFSNLRTIIKKFQDDGAVVVLLGVRGGLLADNFSGEFSTVAKETGSVYVSDVLRDLLGNRQFMADQVHPNDAGYAIIAERVLKALQPVLK